jgi:tetratricopeptide (TPR) repeat protein
MLFLLHPIQVESVAWIIELKNVLSACLALACTESYLRYSSTLRNSWGALTLLSFVLALLAKSSVVPLPLCLVVVTLWGRNESVKRPLVLASSLLAIALVFALTDTWFAHANEAVRDPLPMATRLLLPGYLLWTYLLHLAVPTGLGPLYNPWTCTISSGLLLVGLFVFLLAWCWRQGWKGSAAALLLFAILLSPVLGPVSFAFQRHAYLADRFVYLASIPVMALAGTGASQLRRWLHPRTWYVCTGATLVMLGGLTARQSALWGNEVKFWDFASRHNPGSSLAATNLGLGLMRDKRDEAALASFQRALQLDGTNASAHLNSGAIYDRHGMLTEAEGEYRAALQNKPDYAEAYYNLGLLKLRVRNTGEARQLFLRALQINPLYTAARQALARTGGV